MSPTFQLRYPWTVSPLIANAAMGGFAGAHLAVAISRAGGVGFIGATPDMADLELQLTLAKTLLVDDDLKVKDLATIPLGVGFLTFATEMDAAADVIARHLPAAIWLSCAPRTDDYEIWTKKMRAISPSSKIWIQVASVSAAIQVASSCAPDVLITQGSDAGGHGPYPGAGIVTLIPEARDALDAAGYAEIDVFAAGGIVEGRGLAAALVAGAKGVVMGTRFLASEEINLPAAEFQDTILTSRDGGKSTARAVVFDELSGKNIWPPGYDGRAIAGPSYQDFQDGVSLAEIQRRYADAAGQVHKGYGGEARAAIWAGTSVGLITEVKAAGDIVLEVRDSARKCLSRVFQAL